MSTTEDFIRKTLSDPKPLYALAGAGDLAAEKLKETPERFKDAPTLLAEAGANLSTLANRVALEAPERIAKLTSSVQSTVGKVARPDTDALREKAQIVAIQQVGRLLEAAGRAVETYDELAERGRIVVARYNSSVDSMPGQTVEPPVTVVVEQISEEDELTFDFDEPAEEPAVESAAEAAEAFEAFDAFEEPVARESSAADAPAAEPAPAAKKSARKRTTGGATSKPRGSGASGAGSTTTP